MPPGKPAQIRQLPHLNAVSRNRKRKLAGILFICGRPMGRRIILYGPAVNVPVIVSYPFIRAVFASVPGMGGEPLIR